jgi:hypothetical protein
VCAWIWLLHDAALLTPLPPPGLISAQTTSTCFLAGSGRAGKPGRLLGSDGGVYEGDVLAGRPHGWGRYYGQGPDPARGLQLLYEGEYFKGQRQGQGTAHYGAPGEKYVGQWAAGQRHGQGRLEFANGDVYEGAWRRGRRHGAGVLLVKGGPAVFVGTFVADKRQGLGTLYLVSKGEERRLMRISRGAALRSSMR